MEVIRFVDSEMDNIELIAIIKMSNITNEMMDKLEKYIEEGYHDEKVDGFYAIAKNALEKTFGNDKYEIPPYSRIEMF